MGRVSRVSRVRFRASLSVSMVRVRVIRWSFQHRGDMLGVWPKIPTAESDLISMFHIYAAFLITVLLLLLLCRHIVLYCIVFIYSAFTLYSCKYVLLNLHTCL